MENEEALARIDRAMHALSKYVDEDELDDLHEQLTERAVDELAEQGLTSEEDLYMKLAELFEDELLRYKEGY